RMLFRNEIIEAKGATYYGIAMGLIRITKAILKDEDVVLPVGTLLEGEYGYVDVYIGVPPIINGSGAVKICELTLDDQEKEKLEASVKALKEIKKHFCKYIFFYLHYYFGYTYMSVVF